MHTRAFIWLLPPHIHYMKRILSARRFCASACGRCWIWAHEHDSVCTKKAVASFQADIGRWRNKFLNSFASRRLSASAINKNLLKHVAIVYFTICHFGTHFFFYCRWVNCQRTIDRVDLDIVCANTIKLYSSKTPFVRLSVTWRYFRFHYCFMLDSWPASTSIAWSFDFVHERQMTLIWRVPLLKRRNWMVERVQRPLVK